MHGEEESLSGQRLSKDHSWRIAEYSWVSGSENIRKKLSNSPYITTCCSGGFQENSPSSSKNKLQHIQLSDMTVTSNGTGFYAQMKLKNELFSSKHSRWVWCNRDKKSTPCVKWNILLYFLCCGPIFLPEVLDIGLDTWHHGFY